MCSCLAIDGLKTKFRKYQPEFCSQAFHPETSDWLKNKIDYGWKKKVPNNQKKITGVPVRLVNWISKREIRLKIDLALRLTLTVCQLIVRHCSALESNLFASRFYPIQSMTGLYRPRLTPQDETQCDS